MAENCENLIGRVFTEATKAGWDDRPALCEASLCLNYQELRDLVQASAGALQTLGVKPGDRVAVFSPDSVDAAVAILSLVYIGAIAIPVNDLSSANDLRNRLQDAEASVVLAHPDLWALADELQTEVESFNTCIALGSGTDDSFGTLAKSATPCTKAVEVSSAQPAFLLYSAAVSAQQSEFGLRGVAHGHETPVRAFESFAQNLLGMTPDDKIFSTVRLSTAYGLSVGLIFPLLAGAQCLLLPEQARSQPVFDALKVFKPSIFAATPSLYGQLSRDAVRTPQGKPLKDVRFCVAGAESVPPKVIAMVRGVLGSNVTVGYGLTEAFQFVIAGPAEGRRPGYCGHKLEGINVRVVDDEGKEVGVDEIGTLELSGPTVISKYWGSEKKVSEDGWFRTQDRFMVDENQGYFHCGRVDSLFKVGGKWVSPAEVERALLANEAVWECAVIGADDEDGLIKPFAFVVVNLGQNPSPSLEAELKQYVKAELAPYKYPRWIEFVDEIPKGPSGVILRFKLRDRLKESRSRRRAESHSDIDL